MRGRVRGIKYIYAFTSPFFAFFSLLCFASLVLGQ